MVRLCTNFSKQQYGLFPLMNILKQRDVKIKLIEKKLKQWKVALKDSKLLAFKKCFFFQQLQSD